METKTFAVNGMACGHCKASVEKALTALNGVENAEVNLNEKNVTMVYDASLVDVDHIKSAVESAGHYEFLG